MTSREELIGKIAEAIDDAQESKRRNGFAATPGELAEAALAVFEEAHTPTDDEQFAKSFSGWSPDEVARNPRAAAEVIERLRSRLIDSFRPLIALREFEEVLDGREG